MLENKQRDFLDWAAKAALPLDAQNPDFSYLARQLDGVRLIAFGESQHYTTEFNHVQSEMLKQLAGAGVTAFAYESPFADAKLVNDYVLGMSVEADDVFFEGICFTFSVWKEMRALAEWMRTYNQTQPDEKKLRYYGVDIGSCTLDGNSAVTPLTHALDYLRGVEPAYAEKMAYLLDDAAAYDMFSFGEVPEAARDSFYTAVAQLHSHIEKRGPAYCARTGKDAYAWALQCAKNAVFCASCMTASANGEPAADVNSVRELCMADNLMWVLAQERRRGVTIFHSHNIHIRKTVRSDGTVPTGAYLAQMTAPGELLVIAATNERSIRPGDQCDPDSMEYLLAQLEPQTYLLDWREMPAAAASALDAVHKDRQNMAYTVNQPRAAYDMVYFTKRAQQLSVLDYRPYDDALCVQADTSGWAAFCGQYHLRRCWWAPAPGERTDVITITLEDGQLFSSGLYGESGELDMEASSAEHFPIDKSALFPLDDTTFFWKNWFGRLRFVREADGAVSRAEFIHYDEQFGNIIADRIS